MFIFAETVKNLLKIAFLAFKKDAERIDATDKTRKIETNNATAIKTWIKTRDATIIKIAVKKERTNTEIKYRAEHDENS